MASNAEQREIAAEQTYVDTVYERLEESAKVAQSLVAEGFARGHVGNEGGLVERDAMVYQASRRLSALNAAHDGLVFGRLNLLDGESRYIGRIGVRDADREIILVDWRAPAAAVFYQATAQDPAGVVRRRVLRCSGNRVVGVEDDLLDADNAPDDMVVVGEGALLASLSRARDSSMHSVVATIQKEQDEAIRAPSRGATIIGGGPGTGKTVVALHRAAYLLYTDRRRFESGGVLVVGPSNVFMNYIERVLPSLGETSVTLRALGEVVDGVKATRHDDAVAAAAKGSSRMMPVLRRLASAPQLGEPTEFRYFYKDDVLLLDARQLAGVRRHLLHGMKRNRAYSRAPAALVDALWKQVGGERALEKGEEGFIETISTDDAFIDFVEAWWPPVDAVELWHTLPNRIDELGDGAFSADELTALKASWGDVSDGGEPRIEDVPLIDELRYLVGEVPHTDDDDDDLPRQLMSFERRERDERDDRLRATRSIEDDGFAHVLVDEAQDLSPLQWRMLARRGRHASWTIVGDPAQSSWPHPGGVGSGPHGGVGGQARARVPAVHQLPQLGRDLRPRRAGRIRRGARPRPRRRGPPHRRAPRAPRRRRGSLARRGRRAHRGVAGGGRGHGRCRHRPRRRRRDARRARRPSRRVSRPASGPGGTRHQGPGVRRRVVVEPDAITDESGSGWRTLYVVLTRATQRLTTVGSTDRWRAALT